MAKLLLVRPVDLQNKDVKLSLCMVLLVRPVDWQNKDVNLVFAWYIWWGLYIYKRTMSSTANCMGAIHPDNALAKCTGLYNTIQHYPGFPRSWKILEKIAVMESHGKVLKYMKLSQKVMEKSWNCLFSWLWQLSSL